jgi:hypothetical protein
MRDAADLIYRLEAGMVRVVEGPLVETEALHG